MTREGTHHCNPVDPGQFEWSPRPEWRLTPREASILDAYQSAWTYKGAAAQLGIAEATVKNTVYAMTKRLHIEGGISEVLLRYDRELRGFAPTWPAVDRRHGERRQADRRAPTIIGYANPDGSGEGNWAEKQP